MPKTSGINSAKKTKFHCALNEAIKAWYNIDHDTQYIAEKVLSEIQVIYGDTFYVPRKHATSIQARKLEIATQYKAGLSIRQISKFHKISSSSVYLALSQHQVALRPVQRRQSESHIYNKEECKDLMAQGLSVPQIAKMLGANPETVRARIRAIKKMELL